MMSLLLLLGLLFILNWHTIEPRRQDKIGLVLVYMQLMQVHIVQLMRQDF